MKKSLENNGFQWYGVNGFQKLPPPVSAHPDMLFFKYKNIIITYLAYLQENLRLKNFIENHGYFCLSEKRSPSMKYPHDIALNFLHSGEYLLGKTEYISPILKKVCRSMKVIDAHQGYARCSVLKLNENTWITSDPSLQQVASQYGIECLPISPGGILLDGYSYGFIGGCSFVYENKVYFFGNSTMHPDYSKMEVFCSKHNKNIVNLSDSPLYDYGGAVLL